MTLTPFRYPGAKNKLLKVLMPYIDQMMIGQNAFCDAFVGGGSVALEVAKKYPKAHIYINDKDWWMYSFWHVVCEGDDHLFEGLLSLIDQKPTLELFNSLKANDTKDKLTCAYKAIFLNRTCFSGIFKSGPIGGKYQTGKDKIDCRYNADKLKKKIIVIRKLLRDRVTVSNIDINGYLLTINCPMYLDPPYYIKGESLYNIGMKHQEHEKMRDLLMIKNHWLLSYDDCFEIRDMYKDFTDPTQMFTINARYCITGNNVKWEDKHEILIYKP